jgi:hypothetical protein
VMGTSGGHSGFRGTGPKLNPENNLECPQYSPHLGRHLAVLLDRFRERLDSLSAAIADEMKKATTP